MSEKVAISPPLYRFGNYLLDSRQKLLFCGDEVIPLNQKAFECLLLLVENADRVVLKEDFFEKIWKDSFVEDGVLAVNISLLRKTLETENSQKFIETLPRRGYKFIAKVEIETEKTPGFLSDGQISENNLNKISNSVSDSSELYSKNKPDLEAYPKIRTGIREFKLSKAHIAGLCLLAIILSGALFLVYKRNSKINSTTSPNKVSVAIFPFENVSGNQELDYLSLSLADSLNYSLAPISYVNAVPTSAIKKYVGQTYDPNVEGKNLGVENIVIGSYHTENDKITLDVQIRDISKQKTIVQNQQFDVSVNNLTTLRTSIFKFLVTGLNLNKTDDELVEIQQQETQNPQAYEYYLKGSNAYFNTQLDTAISYYEKAVESDPNFLPALEGLAAGYRQKGSMGGCGAICYQKSIEYFEKTVQIAPHYERGQLNLALSYVDSNQIDKAIPLIKDVMARNKDNKQAYFYLSYAYRYAGLLDESAQLGEQSRTTDNQDSSFANIFIGYIYQQKYAKFLQDTNIPSTNSYGLFYKGFANYYLKNYAEAKKAFDEAYEISSNTLTEKIGKVYSYHIDKSDDAALKLLNEIHADIIKNQVGDGEIIYKIAQAYAELKQSKSALELFNLSVEKGFFCYPYFANDPLMDNVRKEPEFETILQKAKKRHEEFKSKYSNGN